MEREEPIAVVLLNRPKQLNALSTELMDELAAALKELDREDAIRAIVLGGSERAFAAGADIDELSRATPIDLYHQRRMDRWEEIRPSGRRSWRRCRATASEAAASWRSPVMWSWPPRPLSSASPRRTSGSFRVPAVRSAGRGWPARPWRWT